MFRKLSILLFCGFLVTFGAECEQQNQVIFVITEPLLEEQSNSIDITDHSKFKLSVIEILGDRLGVNIDVLAVPFQRALFMMENGTADFMVGVYRSREREEFMEYGNFVLYSDAMMLISLKKNSFRWGGDISSLKKRQLDIALIRDGEYGDAFNGDDNKNWNIAFLKSSFNLFQFLAMERVDLIACSRQDINYYLEQLDLWDRVIIHEPPISYPSRFISRSKNSKSLITIEIMDKLLSHLEETGELRKLKTQYDIFTRSDEI